MCCVEFKPSKRIGSDPFLTPLRKSANHMTNSHSIMILDQQLNQKLNSWFNLSWENLNNQTWPTLNRGQLVLPGRSLPNLYDQPQARSRYEKVKVTIIKRDYQISRNSESLQHKSSSVEPIINIKESCSMPKETSVCIEYPQTFSPPSNAKVDLLQDQFSCYNQSNVQGDRKWNYTISIKFNY